MKTRLFDRRNAMKLGAAASLAPFFRVRAQETDGGNTRRLGVALLGLGDYATKQLGPALKETLNARLTGIVTGSPEKIPAWQKEYDVPDGNVYNYENMDLIADNDEIDIIYVVTPTGKHRDFAIRAAKTGKHVICEKPMAPTVEDCTMMIDAAKEAGVTLQIGYRLHWVGRAMAGRATTSARRWRRGPWKSNPRMATAVRRAGRRKVPWSSSM